MRANTSYALWVDSSAVAWSCLPVHPYSGFNIATPHFLCFSGPWSLLVKRIRSKDLTIGQAHRLKSVRISLNKVKTRSNRAKCPSPHHQNYKRRSLEWWEFIDEKGLYHESMVGCPPYRAIRAPPCPSCRSPSCRLEYRSYSIAHHDLLGHEALHLPSS